jgi:hypothetical protein
MMTIDDSGLENLRIHPGVLVLGNSMPISVDIGIGVEVKVRQ